MPKDKDGNKLTWKEFFDRWKKGIEQVSMLDQMKYQMRSNKLILFGITAGFVLSAMNLKDLWWLAIILLGALFNTYIQHLAIKQKYNTLKQYKVERRSDKNDTIKRQERVH